jgi:hypothetical protein
MLTALLMATCAASLSGERVADAPYSARLFAQADIPAPTVSRIALEAERSRILETRPGLGFPITMISIGSGVSVLFIAIAASVASSYWGISGEGVAILSVLIASGLGMVAIGIVSLIGRLAQRRDSEPRLKSIDSQLQKLGPATPEDYAPPPGPPPPPPGPDQPPGPPPPPPPPLALFTF